MLYPRSIDHWVKTPAPVLIAFCCFGAVQEPSKRYRPLQLSLIVLKRWKVYLCCWRYHSLQIYFQRPKSWYWHKNLFPKDYVSWYQKLSCKHSKKGKWSTALPSHDFCEPQHEPQWYDDNQKCMSDSHILVVTKSSLIRHKASWSRRKPCLVLEIKSTT